MLNLDDEVERQTEPWTEIAALRKQIAELESEQLELLQTRLLVERSSVTLFQFRFQPGYPIDFVTDNVAQYGYTAEELRSGTASISELIHPDDFQRLLQRAGAAPGHEQSAFREECRIITHAHDVRWTDLRVIPVREPAGRVTHVQGFMVDATERKRLESQLVQSQKQEIMGRLAGSVAHDFNNVLTAIIGYASLARDALFPNDPVREDVEQVIEIAERAASRTHRLLMFGRQQTMTPRTVSLKELLADMDEMLRGLLGDNIHLAILAAEDLGQIKADPGQIEQVLISLAVMAHDAMPDGGELVLKAANLAPDGPFLAAHQGVEPGEYVTLSASAAGTEPGRLVDLSSRETILATSEPEPGAPASLATVYSIVRQHQGYTWTHTGPGGAASIEICLPRHEEPEHTSLTRPELASPVGQETVLLVEDENAVRGPVARSLRDLGYRVLEARNGVAALSVAQTDRGRIDILVTDVVMPQMNGVELAHQLGATRSGLKVLLVSGYSDDDLNRYGVLDRETAFLQKPYTVQTLARKIREVLEANLNQPSEEK